jgi:hypothetical protein
MGNKVMTQYSRKTVLAATDLLENVGHARINRFLLEHDLENAVAGGSTRDRATALARYLLQYPEVLNEDGENLTDAVVEQLVTDVIRGFVSYEGEFDYDTFSQMYGELNRALARDGFTVEGGQLRRNLPEALDLPQADDEVHEIMRRQGFDVPSGHLDQAIAAYGRGEWAGANGQLRTFVEALFDAIALRLSLHLNVEAPAHGHPSKLWLARLNPPFFVAELNEWVGQGTGFVEGFIRRLHPQGAHPGLSDEEDSTFRLHLVLLVARAMLRRLEERLR